MGLTRREILTELPTAWEREVFSRGVEIMESVERLLREDYPQGSLAQDVQVWLVHARGLQQHWDALEGALGKYRPSRSPSRSPKVKGA